MPASLAPAPPRTRWTWLPDAAQDAHPFGTWLLVMGFEAWIALAYHRTLITPPDFSIPPGTLIASNHQRDVDGPMLGTLLVQRRGLRLASPLPFFATREDLFRPGILARLTVHWPRPLSALLGHISLAWFFPLGRAEPMRRIREFTFGEALRALAAAGFGARPAATLLNARGRRETGTRPGGCTLAALLTRRDLPLERWWGWRRLSADARTALASGFRQRIDAQLAHFATRLDHGRLVYFAPEGTISMDGHFGRVRAGSFRLARLAASPPWILPMALGYDTLGPGRPRAVVRIGLPFRANTALDRRGFDATLRATLLALEPITLSHLLARFLLHGPTAFTRAALMRWLQASIATLRARNASLDPVLATDTVEREACRRLRWMERTGLVQRSGETFRYAGGRDAAPGWRTSASIARYLDNRMADLLPDVARMLPC